MSEHNELLQLAAEKLDRLSSHANTDEWFAIRTYVGAGEHPDADDIAQAEDAETAELIATLGRATSTLSVVLLNARRHGTLPPADALALARAILLD